MVRTVQQYNKLPLEMIDSPSLKVERLHCQLLGIWIPKMDKELATWPPRFLPNLTFHGCMILWGGIDKYMQRSEGIGLIMNERLKIMSKK